VNIWKYLGCITLAWLPILVLMNIFWDPAYWQTLLIIVGAVWYRLWSEVGETYMKDAIEDYQESRYR
jgi:hypothetical protein